MANKRVVTFSVLFALILGVSLYALVSLDKPVTNVDTKENVEQKENVAKDKEGKKKFEIIYYNGIQLNDENGNYIGPDDPIYYREACVQTSYVAQDEDGGGFLKSIEYNETLGKWELTFIIKDRKEVTVRYKTVVLDNGNPADAVPGFPPGLVYITKDNYKKLPLGGNYIVSVTDEPDLVSLYYSSGIAHLF